MTLEHIKLSQQAKEQLLKLKRRTGIRQWNTLSRWALCVSLAEATEPPDADIPADSSVEMRWEVFGGEYREIYHALIVERCHRLGLATTPDIVAKKFRLHLHRGIGYLSADKSIEEIDGLLARAVTS